MFPIEVNIPDTISSFSNGVQSFAGNLAQRIPIINRWTNWNPNQPRPLKYFMLVPIETRPDAIDYNPYLGLNQPSIPLPKLPEPPKPEELTLFQKLYNKIIATKNATDANCTEPNQQTKIKPIQPEDYKKERDTLLQYLELVQEHNNILQNQWGPVPQMPVFSPGGFNSLEFNRPAMQGKYGLFPTGPENSGSDMKDVEINKRAGAMQAMQGKLGLFPLNPEKIVDDGTDPVRSVEVNKRTSDNRYRIRNEKVTQKSN